MGGEDYVLAMSNTPARAANLSGMAGMVGAAALGLMAVKGYDTSVEASHQQRQRAEESAIAKRVAEATPRCVKTLSETEKAFLSTGLTPCQSRNLSMQVAAEREAMRNKVAFNRQGR